MTTVEKAAIYSSMLKHYYGVGPDEALELAAVLDDMIAAASKYHTLASKYRALVATCRALVKDKQA